MTVNMAATKCSTDEGVSIRIPGKYYLSSNKYPMFQISPQSPIIDIISYITAKFHSRRSRPIFLKLQHIITAGQCLILTTSKLISHIIFQFSVVRSYIKYWGRVIEFPPALHSWQHMTRQFLSSYEREIYSEQILKAMYMMQFKFRIEVWMGRNSPLSIDGYFHGLGESPIKNKSSAFIHLMATYDQLFDVRQKMIYPLRTGLFLPVAHWPNDTIGRGKTARQASIPQ